MMLVIIEGPYSTPFSSAFGSTESRPQEPVGGGSGALSPETWRLNLPGSRIEAPQEGRGMRTAI